MASLTIDMNVVLKNKKHLDDFTDAVERLGKLKEEHPELKKLSESLDLLESAIDGFSVDPVEQDHLILYYFRGKGAGLPSEVSVVASTEDHALEMATNWANAHGVDAGTLRLCRFQTFNPNGHIVHAWDGGY